MRERESIEGGREKMGRKKQGKKEMRDGLREKEKETKKESRKNPRPFLALPASCHDSGPHLLPYLYSSPSELRPSSTIFLKQSNSVLSYPHIQLQTH